MGLGYDLRGVQHLGGGGITDDLSVMKNDSPGGVFQHQVHIVGNENDSDALAVQRPEELHNVRIMAEILTSSGFVQNHDLRTQNQYGGDGYAFFLSIAQGGDRPVPERIQPADFHAGARPSHAAWQGKLVSLSGKKGYLDKRDIGYGTGPGFKGWNCRHDWYPFFEGISHRAYSNQRLKELSEKKVVYNDEEIGYYEATQKQREMERQIRATRRELNGYTAAMAGSRL